jgi:hypothetical protein
LIEPPTVEDDPEDKLISELDNMNYHELQKYGTQKFKMKVFGVKEKQLREEIKGRILAESQMKEMEQPS